MRIDCCHCGPRSSEEFTYLGDATVSRPGLPVTPPSQAAGQAEGRHVTAADAALSAAVRLAGPQTIQAARGAGTMAAISPSRAADQLAAMHDYVYLRDNPSGPHRELWQHIGGCRACLVVTRNTQTHEILAVELARTATRSTPTASATHE